MIYIGYDDTGRPVGYQSSTEKEALNNHWPHMTLWEGEGEPDLSTHWIVNGSLVPRDQVNDQPTLEAMAVQEAVNAKVLATAQALDAAPHPTYAAKATQATFTLGLRMLNKQVQGEALTQEEKDLFNSLTLSFTGAASAMSDTEALSYIQAQLEKSDAADAVIKGA